MATRRTYVDYLKDMLEATESAEAFAKGMDFQQFRTDQKTVLLS